MATRENSNQTKSSRQGKKSLVSTLDHQRMPEFQANLEEQCNRLAEEVANIPAVVREYLSKVEGNGNNKRDHYDSNQELTSRLKRAELEAQRKDSAIHHLQSELEACKYEIQTLRAKEQSLRDFVLESDGYQEISDEEVIDAFTKIRQQTQKLASSRQYQVDGRTLDFECSGFAFEKDLSVLWQRSTRTDRLLILRALLFQILTDNVFTIEFFGIAESEANECQFPEIITDLDAGLSQFERILVNRNVPNDAVANWRLSTLRSVEAAGMTGGAFGTALAEQMYDCFATLIPERTTLEEREKLRNAFRNLCNQAYALRLLMRRSKENYQCLPVPSGASPDEMKHIADDFGALEGRPDGRAKVALTIFGALVIHPRAREEELRVLEKAQVIVSRK